MLPPATGRFEVGLEKAACQRINRRSRISERVHVVAHRHRGEALLPAIQSGQISHREAARRLNVAHTTISRGLARASAKRCVHSDSRRQAQSGLMTLEQASAKGTPIDTYGKQRKLE